MLQRIINAFLVFAAGGTDALTHLSAVDFGIVLVLHKEADDAAFQLILVFNVHWVGIAAHRARAATESATAVITATAKSALAVSKSTLTAATAETSFSAVVTMSETTTMVITAAKSAIPTVVATAFLITSVLISSITAVSAIVSSAFVSSSKSTPAVVVVSHFYVFCELRLGLQPRLTSLTRGDKDGDGRELSFGEFPPSPCLFLQR
jgi:hypothetical protein